MHARSWRGIGARSRARPIEEMGVAVAHQLKSPLSAVKALVQLGLRNPAESPSHGRLTAVEAEVARVLEILETQFAAGRSEPAAASAGAHPGDADAPEEELRRTG